MCSFKEVGSFSSAAADAEPRKALRCPGPKPSGPADDKEDDSMIVRLTLSSNQDYFLPYKK